MPGCTAPNCTNSSQKGYKLYHFPSDPERCALWVKYCGREKGWQPTKHMCLCEIHFELSQFESHREDGLKKLKPFAVPTKFSKANPNHRIGTQKKIKEDSLNSAQKHEGIENIIINSSEVITSSESSEFLRKCNGSARKKRRMCHTTLPCKDDVRTAVHKKARSEFESEKQNSELMGKKLSKVSSLCDMLSKSKLQSVSKDIKFHSDCNKTQGGNSRSEGNNKKKFNFIPLSKDPLKCVLQQSVAAMKDKEKTNSETNVCFICDQNIEKSVPLSSYTETSKTQFDQKLIQLVVQEFDILVEDSAMLCKICAQTLNCIDYVESVLHTLSKGIINRMKKKFGMQLTEEIDLPNYIKYLKNLNDFYYCKELSDKHFSQKKYSNQLYSNQASNQSHTFEIIEDCERKNHRKQVSTRIKFECQICSYKTTFKAVMTFHLRQHYQHLYSCDFCNSPVAFGPSPSGNTCCKDIKVLENRTL